MDSHESDTDALTNGVENQNSLLLDSKDTEKKGRKWPLLCCLKLEKKLKKNQLKQQLQQTHLRRQIAIMNTNTNAYHVPTVQESAVGTVSLGGAVQAPPGVNMVAFPNPGPPQLSDTPGIGIKPGTTSSENVLQVLKEVQEETARQQVSHAAYNKVSPFVEEVIPPPYMQMAQVPSGASLISMDQQQHPWYPPEGFQLNAELRPQNPQLLQSTGQAGLPKGGTVRLIQPQVQPQQMRKSSIHQHQQSKQALNQLLQTLKSPSSNEQQQQILHFLKDNPQIMASFIKERTVFRQKQQQSSVVTGGPVHIAAPDLINEFNSLQIQQPWLQHNEMGVQQPQLQHLGMGGAGPGLGQHAFQQQESWYNKQLLAIHKQQQQQQQQGFGGYAAPQQRLPGLRTYPSQPDGFPGAD